MKRFRPFGIWFLVLVCNLLLGLPDGRQGICDLPAQEKPSSGELISKAWAAHGGHDTHKAFQYTQQLIDLYKKEADKQHVALKDFPNDAQEPLSDVAVAYFIQAEILRDQAKTEEAVQKFQFIIDSYPYAVAWDPSRGVYWKIARVAQESIDKIKEKISPETQRPKPTQPPRPKGSKTTVVLYDSGKEDLVDYEKYGEFQDIGSKEYKYKITDQEGLSQAVGEGIYPNTTAVRWDPQLKKARKEKRLEGSHWDFVHSPDLEAAFFKWALSTEPEGIKLFYAANILEKSGLIIHALKAYYAIVVHYPNAVGWTYWHTPWYVGPAAIAKIQYILRKNPQLGLKLVNARIRVINGYDSDIKNDIILTNPGHFEKVSSRIAAVLYRIGDFFLKAGKKKISVRTIGEGTVRLAQHTDGSWVLLVEGEPFTVKAVTYAPTKIGQSPDKGTMGNWMQEDFNNNKKIDGPYDSYLEGSPNKPIGDFQLMKDMGVNAIRLYHHPLAINKELLRDLWRNYGIRVIIGDFLGKYALGSDVPWNPGTDYKNEEHKKKMLASVRKMVEEFKDEPYVLFWILGNENIYGVACNADKDPDSFFAFVNEAAQLIKSLDKNHPVAIASGDVLFLDKFASTCPDVDIFGTNVYRGGYGFGNLWQCVKEEADKPALITEFGCPAYAEGMTKEEAETAQADYHQAAWDDIFLNMNVFTGVGNSIGGIVFEFLDEWWKAYEPGVHDTKGFFTGPFPDGYMHEEWLGLVGQGDGKDSPFKRHLRKSYYMYQRKWKK